MDLSTDTDFISGALKLMTGVDIVSRGEGGDGGVYAGSFDLDCLHKKSLQWRGEDVIPAVSVSKGEGSGVMKISIVTLTGQRITVSIPLLTKRQLRSMPRSTSTRASDTSSSSRTGSTWRRPST